MELCKDQIIKITLGAGNESEDQWKITNIEDEMVDLVSINTHMIYRVHKSRIISVTDSSGIIHKVMAEPEAESDEVEKLDFKKLSEEGEIWTRKAKNFTHKHVKVKSHTQILLGNLKYRTFNTYNDSLGKKGKGIRESEFKNKETADKRRKKLIKRGYELEYPNQDHK